MGNEKQMVPTAYGCIMPKSFIILSSPKKGSHINVIFAKLGGHRYDCSLPNSTVLDYPMYP